MLLVLRYVLRVWGSVAPERRDLVLENIALRHQIEVLTRTRRRPALKPGDRLLWSLLARAWPAWRQQLVIVHPDTVVRWHRAGWRRYWTWRSRAPRRGRPRIDVEIATEIRRMTTENPRWGHMRVLGELRKLGFRVSLQTIRRYRKDVPRDPSSSWRTFLENHRPEIWASDFFTVHTLWFQTLHVFFFIAHDRRTVMHFNVTEHPSATWVWRQLIEATPWGEGRASSSAIETVPTVATSSHRRCASASARCSGRSLRHRRTRSPSGSSVRFGASAWTTSAS